MKKYPTCNCGTTGTQYSHLPIDCLSMRLLMNLLPCEHKLPDMQLTEIVFTPQHPQSSHNNSFAHLLMWSQYCWQSC